jgi:hypothetical protein
MCDYSLEASKTRPAKVNDKLTVRRFGWSTRGFAASEDANVSVCLLPGTELCFSAEVRKASSIPWLERVMRHKTAIFPAVHHDALEFPDGQILLLTFLAEGQRATVLQLPASAVLHKTTQEGARAPSPAKIPESTCSQRHPQGFSGKFPRSLSFSPTRAREVLMMAGAGDAMRAGGWRATAFPFQQLR